MARINLFAKNMPTHVSLDYIEAENKRGKVTVIDWNESYFDEESPCNAELRSIYLQTDDEEDDVDYSEKHILTAVGTAQTIRLGFSLLAPKAFHFPQDYCGNIALSLSTEEPLGFITKSADNCNIWCEPVDGWLT